MHVSTFEFSCLWFIDLFLYLCANTTLKNWGYIPILIYCPLWGGGPSQSGVPRILSRVRKCPQCSQHLPSVTSPTACYWALSSAAKTLQTDLKTSFNRTYQLKKSWSIFEGSSLYHISHTMFLQQSVPFSSLEKDSRKMQPRMRNYINRECDSHLWNLKSYF